MGASSTALVVWSIFHEHCVIPALLFSLETPRAAAEQRKEASISWQTNISNLQVALVKKLQWAHSKESLQGAKRVDLTISQEYFILGSQRFWCWPLRVVTAVVCPRRWTHFGAYTQTTAEGLDPTEDSERGFHRNPLFWSKLQTAAAVVCARHALQKLWRLLHPGSSWWCKKWVPIYQIQ